SSDDEIPVEDQPIPANASPTALSPGYVVDFDPLKEDLEEDPANDPIDGGDDDKEEESSEDDDEEEEEEASEEDEDEEEENEALTDSAALPIIDLVPSAEETEPFKTDEAQKTIRLQSPMAASTKALIAEFASAPIPPSSPPSPLSPWLSPLPQIPSPPLPKRLCLTTPASRFEAGESSTATAARHTTHTLAHRVDYEFVDIVDASIRASESRVMTAVEERDRQYSRSMASSYEREAVIARQAWSHSEDRSTDLEATIRAQKARTTALEA
ncbi:hypothetical protein Tco_1309211, partial [Tanacetum coccineum]